MRVRNRILAAVLAAAAILLATPAMPASAGSHTDLITTWKINSINVPARGVVYVPSRDTLLVTVSATNPSLGNELVEMHPNTGAILRRVHVGSEPGRIGVSDDGNVAFVALAASAIIKVDLESFTLVETIKVPRTSAGFLMVDDVAVPPGQSDIVVASLASRGFPRHAGVYAFANGAALPNFTDSQYKSNHLVFTDATHFYGFDAENYNGYIRKMAVDENGVTLLNPGYAARANGTVDAELAGDGLVATRNGKLVNPEADILVRSFANANGALEPTPSEDRVAYISSADNYPVFSQFEISTGQLKGARQLPPVRNATDLEATGSGYAIISANGALHLFGPDVVTDAVALPAGLPSTIGALENRVKTTMLPNDLLWDAGRRLLYAAMSAQSTAYPNEVVGIDPITTNVVKRIAVGSNPVALASTADFSTLYVGRSGTNAIAKINLATFTVGAPIPLAPVLNEAAWAGDLEVRPGTTDSLAVVLKTASSGAGAAAVALYNGTTRATEMVADFNVPTVVHWASPTKLYGIDGSNSGYYFTEMDRTDTGLQRVDSFMWFLSGSAEFTFDSAGILWGGSGEVFEPSQPWQKGRLPFPSIGPIVLDEAQDRVYQWVNEKIYETEKSTGRRVSIINPNAYTNGKVMTRFGDGFASINDSNQLILLTPPWCEGKPITVNAGTKTTVTGTAGDDVIRGTAGNDTINGLGGNDIICGAGGSDFISGGDGNDVLVGADGADWITGGNGHDILYGKAGIDYLFGDAGKDTLYGSYGNDRLSGGPGADIVEGNDGTDIYSIGTDSATHVVSLDDVANDGTMINGVSEGDNIRPDIEIVTGTPGRDVVYGTDRGDWILGAGGNDELHGGYGNDQLDGGPGNDVLLGEAGDDNLYGGDQIDVCRGGVGNDFMHLCETSEQ